MDFFTSLEVSKAGEDNVQPNALRTHNSDTTIEQKQNETQKSETGNDSKDYSLYQRDLLLGVNDDDNSTEEPAKTPDTSYMAGIRKRLLEKKKHEQERKKTSAAQITKKSQEIEIASINSAASTQIIARTNEKTQVIDNELQPSIDDDNSTKETQIISTSIIDSSTQVIQSIAELNDQESDNDDKVTQRIRTNIVSEPSDSENESINIVKKKPFIQIGSEDENYDDEDDQISVKKRFDKSDLQKTETEKRLESIVLDDLFSKKGEDINSGAVPEEDISHMIENYQSLSRDERIKARLALHKRAREEQEHFKKQQLKETENDLQEETSMTDKQFVSNLEKKQKEKAKLRQKLKQKEKMERIQQAKLIQEAADAIKHFDSTKLTKEKLLEQLENNDNVCDLVQKNLQSVIPHSSPQKPLTEPIKLTPNTIINRGGLNINKVVQLDSSEDESSSDYEDENLNDKLRLLELKRKLVKKNRRQRERLTRESSLDERIKKHITIQMKKNIKTDKSIVDEKMSTEDMVVELLHRDQMRDAERLKREELEAKKKKKEKKMIESGVFPSHDDDPEFSEYSDDENLGEAEVDERETKSYDPTIEEKEENNVKLHTNSNDMHDLKEDSFVMTQNIENINFKTTQTDAFKKLGISMTQLFENKTQLSQNNMLTKSEKFKVMKGETGGLKKICEVNEESTEIMNDLSVDNSTSFLSKMVNIEEEESSFMNSPREKKSNNLKLLLESQTIELGTQADASTQIDDAVESQAPRTNLEEKEEEEEEEDERIQVGRKKKIDDNDSDVAQVSEGEEADDEKETEAERERRLELIKLAKERERSLRAKREKEMRDMGLHKIMENEADESEDEFKGIGGDEGDISEAENSEDEKIIDDASTIKHDPNEFRKKLLENELAEDKALVEKTYKDIKTHKLRERKAKDGVYDMELSDEDDDEYFRLKMLVRQQMEKRQMELEGRNKVTLSDNNPQKPFFDAMAVKLPSKILSFKKAKSSPSVISDLVSDDESRASQSLNENHHRKRPMNQLSLSPKKRRTIPEPKAFDVDSLKEHDIREEARVSVLNELSSDDEDGSSALKKVKSNSMIKLSRENSYKRKSRVTVSQATDGEVDALNVLSSRSTSITASFKNATKKKVRKGMFTGNVVKEVMVTTTAKPVLNSKSSVTKLVAKDSFMSRANMLDEAADKMSSMLAASRKKGIRKLGTSKFRR